VVGPLGTRTLMENLERAYAADIRIRIADEGLPPEGAGFDVEEFLHEGLVHDRGGVRVTAFEVDHGERIRPAFGYRVDCDGRSVVLSGDTRFSENVVRHGAGADLLIHEVATARPTLMADPAVQRVMAHHTAPRDAGRVFSRARPRLAVYTHLVLLSRPGVPAPTVAEVVAETRETYDGPLEVGEDLMCFELREDAVSVQTTSDPWKTWK
jgi:ribonuclease Z